MNLREFFRTHRASAIAAIAEVAGTSRPYLQQCKSGRRRLSADLALRLEQATAGVLTARELRPDLPWPGGPPADPVE